MCYRHTRLFKSLNAFAMPNVQRMIGDVRDWGPITLLPHFLPMFRRQEPPNSALQSATINRGTPRAQNFPDTSVTNRRSSQHVRVTIGIIISRMI